ncbi:clostripain-related cysteine peptidase [Bdellovibrio sp. HCB2-146]|uniref:clostripain-related cysteine peptidase n=1 Tax=Bdellovibrio sp. HCB2-146 TaxID=3394362 RepID=UPI0039BC6181
MKNHLLHFVLVLLAFPFASISQAAEVKEWNFLVFINGVNNLDRFGKMNINQMEEVGSSDKMNILVQWGSLANPNTTRLLVQKDNDKTNVTSPIVQNLGNVDMGDYRELIRFVEWAQQNYPAKKYFITVWNHGSGWNIVRANGTEIRPTDISYDDRTNNHITTEQLATAMAESAKIIGHKVDIYASDACLMGMVEVASQMQDSVSYFLGSQDNEPGEGWPYAHFLRQWAPKVDQLSAKEVTQLHAKEYLTAYSPGGVYRASEVTMSAFDLSKISAYESAIRRVSTYLQSLNSADLTKARQAVSATKQFGYANFYDIVDYVSQLEKKGLNNPSFSALRQAQQDFVIANEQNQDQNTYGVSVWIATGYNYRADANRYNALEFNKNSQWGGFLNVLNK